MPETSLTVFFLRYCDSYFVCAELKNIECNEISVSAWKFSFRTLLLNAYLVCCCEVTLALSRTAKSYFEK